MNKNGYILGLLFTLFITACSGRFQEVLPTISASFLKKHFPDVEVVKVEKTLDLDYEVKLANGVDLTFERRGNWEEINARKNDVTEIMQEILPYNITSYVKTNYPDKSIRKVERKKYGYLVVLNKPNSISLEFNKSGAFITKREEE